MFFEYPKLLWLEIVPFLLILHYITLNCAHAGPI